MLRRGILIAVALLATVPAVAEARKPPVAGWWGGGPAGYDVQFRVVHSGGKAFVQDLSVRCGGLIWTEDAAFSFQATARPTAAPVAANGRIRQGRQVDEYGNESDADVLEGRLARRTGRVGPPVFGTGCESDLEFSSRIRVRALGRPPRPQITDGRWLLRGPVLTQTELSFVVTGGGAQLSGMNGAIGGHLKPTPFGPLPCRDLGAVIRESAVRGDGGFTAFGGDAESTQRRVDGRFTAPRAGSGTYTLRNTDAERGFATCLTGTWPWTAELVEPEGPPAGVLPRPSRLLSWVALGDSYSSGEGVRPFLPGTSGRDNTCHRSRYAYSQVFRLQGYGFHTKRFLACSGAVTDNLGRYGGSGALEGRAQHNEPGPQLAQVTPAEWAQTDLVTLSIGGNDAGFSDVLTQCVFFRCHRGTRARAIRRDLRADVPPKLRTTYAAIRRLAPQATVVVLGYPNLFPAREDFRRFCDLKRTLSGDKRQFLREVGEQLTGILRAETRAAGFHFADPRDEFKGHEPCGRAREWINAIVLRRPREIPEGLHPTSTTSFHPNRLGQLAYAHVLRDYLRCTLTSAWAYKPDSGLPVNPQPGAPGPGCA